ALVAARQRAEDRHDGVVERDVTGSAMLRAGGWSVSYSPRSTSDQRRRNCSPCRSPVLIAKTPSPLPGGAPASIRTGPSAESSQLPAARRAASLAAGRAWVQYDAAALDERQAEAVVASRGSSGEEAERGCSSRAPEQHVLAGGTIDGLALLGGGAAGAGAREGEVMAHDLVPDDMTVAVASEDGVL